MVYIIEILQHFSYSHEYGQYCNKGMLLLAIHYTVQYITKYAVENTGRNNTGGRGEVCRKTK